VNARHAPAACAACGHPEFASKQVLWPELVAAWELSPGEVACIDRQQGTHCLKCGNNLRMVALAAAIMRTVGIDAPLAELPRARPGLRVLEINEAGFLTALLRPLAGHRLVRFPEFDMTELRLPDAGFDLVIHSDTLEHVPDPVRGLAECRRVLAPGGACIFTVPIVVGRLTRRRDGLPPSYHGSPGNETEDQLVVSEFGADAWAFPLQAGFSSCEVVALEYPAALAMVARG
jgi:SAM-dependent methyltransferase